MNFDLGFGQTETTDGILLVFGVVGQHETKVHDCCSAIAHINIIKEDELE